MDRRRFAYALILINVLFASTASRADAQDPGVAPGWQVKPDPPAVSATLPASVTPAIDVPGGEGVLYPTSVSPFVALGNNAETTSARQVYDLRTSAPVGAAIRGKLDISDKAKVSPDGKYLLDDGTFRQPQGSVRIWSFETGEPLRDIQVMPEGGFFSLVDFAGPNRIVTSGSVPGSVRIWDVTTGAKILEIPKFAPRIEESAFSPGRRYLANADHKKVQIYDLTKGVLAGEVAIPPPANGSGYQAFSGLSFSPDGTELLGLFWEGKESHLIVWGLADGKVAVDHTFPGNPKHMAPGSFSYKGGEIEWLPDGSAWLLCGHIVVDRNGGRPVWMFRTATWFKDPGARRMIDNDRVLICSGPDRAKRLEVVTLPWAKIDAATKAIDDPASKALVRPGGEVSLKVEVGKLTSGDPEATRAELVQGVTARLEADGIKVAEGKPVVLRVKYAEAKGETLHELKGQTPFNATPTGRSVTATQGVCTLTYEVSGKKAPLWTGKVAYNPTTMRIQGDLNDAKARDESFKQMMYTLAGEAIPYFISDSTPPMTLPGTTELKDTARKPAGRATGTTKAKPTTRGQTPASVPKGAAPKTKEKAKSGR